MRSPPSMLARAESTPAAGPRAPCRAGADAEVSDSAADLVELAAVAVEFGSHQVLQGVDLKLRPGEIYGLIGPNGAGKSTTLGVITGLVPAKSGAVRVLGSDPRTDSPKLLRRVGVLPERNGLYGWMSASEYLAFFAALRGARASSASLSEQLDRVGLMPRRGQRVGTFSRGMRQRLGIARALLGEPDLLVLDEPTEGLDPRGRRDLHDLLLELSRAQRTGILLCTHLLDDVDRLCSRVGILVGGRTVAEGAVRDLVAGTESMGRYRIVFGGSAPTGDLPPHLRLAAREAHALIVDLDPWIEPSAAWQELLGLGWPIREIHRAGGGLEQLYLSITAGADSPAERPAA